MVIYSPSFPACFGLPRALLFAPPTPITSAVSKLVAGVHLVSCGVGAQSKKISVPTYPFNELYHDDHGIAEKLNQLVPTLGGDPICGVAFPALMV